MKLVIEADGGSRGNPGVAGAGTIIYHADGATVVRKLAYVVGTATNNVAEYYGLLNGLKAAQELGATDLDVRMDSKLVVEQMSGRWKIKHPDMRELALECQTIMLTMNKVTFTWIPRADNAAADALANLAMDANEAGSPVGFVPVDDPTPQLSDDDGIAATDAEKPSPTTWLGTNTSATRMLLLRHGQTDMSVKRQYAGLADPPLTQLGKWQASRAAQRIAARGELAAIISSPLIRCHQTAKAVADLMEMHVITDPGLVELDFGRWDGLTFAEAHEQDPELHSQWLADPTVPTPGGESLVQAHERVEETRKKLQAQYEGQTILVVSHVTPIKSIVRQALGCSTSIFHCLHLDLASFSIAEFYSDGPTCVRLVNDTSHLKTTQTMVG